MAGRRSGLRIVGARGNPQIRRALIRFARWLRTEFGFPIRVPVYLLTRERVRTIDGRLCTASFFAPFSRKDDPHIPIATADWSSARADQGRDNALAGYLCSLAHEDIHYRRWIDGQQMSERGVAVRAGKIVRRYALTTDHP